MTALITKSRSEDHDFGHFGGPGRSTSGWRRMVGQSSEDWVAAKVFKLKLP